MNPGGGYIRWRWWSCWVVGEGGDGHSCFLAIERMRKDGVMRCEGASVLVTVDSVFYTCTASIDLEGKRRA